MTALIPAWIIGGPFVGMLILAFSFKGPSAMGGSYASMPRRDALGASPASRPLDPLHPEAPRRQI